MKRSAMFFLALLVLLSASPVLAETVDPSTTQAAAVPADIQVLLDKGMENLTDEEKEKVTSTLRTLYLQGLSSSSVTANTSGIFNCFDYYNFGSVQVDVGPTLTSTIPGTTMGFTGAVKNANDYPIVAGSVYAKIFFKKTQKDVLTHQNSFALVDQFMVSDNISLAAQGEKPLSFTWVVPQDAETGDYQIAFYFTSAKRYNLLGLSFTDDVTGNTADFSILGGTDTALSFDKNAVTLNGSPYTFASFPPHFTKDELVKAEVKLTNPKDETITVPVSWKLYAWDGLREEALKDSYEEMVTLGPKETKTLSREVPAINSSVSYLVVKAQDQDMQSLLGIRFVRDGIEETRINFPSTLTYPLKAGEEAAVFSCVHSTNQPVVNGNTLTLTLKDESDQVIHTYRYEGDVTGTMMGVKDVFTPSQTYTNFSLTATLEHNGQLLEEVTQKYSCQEIDPSLCPKAVVESVGEDNEQSIKLVTAVAFVLLLGLLFYVLSKKRKESSGIIPSFLLAIIISGALFFGGAPTVEAKSVSWSSTICLPTTDGSSYVCSGGSNENRMDISLQVNYSANVYNLDSGALISDGAIVPVGTRLHFSFTGLSDSDISWFAAGYSADSPYGFWDASSYVLNHMCSYGTNIGHMDQFGRYHAGDMTALLNARSPSVSYNHSGSTAGLSCNADQSVCTVTSAGSVLTSIVMAGTSATFENIFGPTSFFGCIDASYSWYEPGWFGPGTLATFNTIYIPQQSLSFSQTAVSTNNPPNPPTITGPNTATTSVSKAFTVLGSDPDADTIRYAIDWDNNGTVDEYQPSFNYVTSNTSQVTNRSWSTAGVQIFRVRTEDSKGAVSGWTSHTVTTVTVPPVPAATLSATGCNIMSGNSTCSGAATWNIQYSANPNLYNGTTNTTYSTNASGNNSAITLARGNSDIYARNGSTVLQTRTVQAVCDASAPYWRGDHCDSVPPPPAPTIDVTTEHNLIRSGTSAIVDFTVTATYPTTCTIKGAESTTITRSYAAGTNTDTVTTRALTSAQIVTVTCTPNPAIEGTAGTTDELRVEVVPTVQEV